MKPKILLIAFFLAFLFLADTSYAQNRPTGTPPVKRGLTEANLRSCESRQEGVRTRMTSLVRLSMNIMAKFDSISFRVQNFYAEKVLPGGNTLSNYDDLVADIQANKEKVQADLELAEVQSNEFDCGSGDPKGVLNQFRLNMQKVKVGLREYRTAIKDLIVAVRSLAPDDAETPEPFETP